MIYISIIKIKYVILLMLAEQVENSGKNI